MAKCVYCKTELSEETPLDVCDRCGLKVWGDKMFATIKKNMQSARDSGDIK